MMPGTIFLMNLIEKFIQQLIELDTRLFLKINRDWTNPWLDRICPVFREQNVWIPLYLFLLVFMFVNFGKKAWAWLLSFVITIVLTDQTSYFIKKLVARPRPCQDPFLMPHVRLLLDNCPGAFSFVSSHAANHFGMAVFIFFTLKNAFGKWRWLFILWAAAISYSQMYVGVHYPLDILCGSMLGCCWGAVTAKFYHRTFSLK